MDLNVLSKNMMVLVVWMKFFKSEWYGDHPQIWSGDRLQSFLDAIICATTVVACKSFVYHELLKTAPTTLCRSAP